jgi:hypothetical protein
MSLGPKGQICCLCIGTRRLCQQPTETIHRPSRDHPQTMDERTGARRDEEAGLNPSCCGGNMCQLNLVRRRSTCEGPGPSAAKQPRGQGPRMSELTMTITGRGGGFISQLFCHAALFPPWHQFCHLTQGLRKQLESLLAEHTQTKLMIIIAISCGACISRSFCHLTLPMT